MNHPSWRPAHRGFTLIELMVVMVLIALLLTIAVPRYFSVIDAGQIKVQRQNLAVMRDALDKYYGDMCRYPDSLDDLVTRHYLREIPVDPVTQTRDWTRVPPHDGGPGGVFDVAAPQGAADLTAATP